MPNDISADVVVIGVGPGGSSTAYHLVRAGLDVVLLEEGPFLHSKIRGNGLIPTVVHELIAVGVSTAGWMRNCDLTTIGGSHTAHTGWLDQKSLPDYGMARAHMDLDHAFARRAAEAGTRLYEDVTVIDTVQDSPGRVTDVQAKNGRGKSATTTSVRTSITVDAGGVTTRLTTSLGLEKKMNHPMGMAAHTYFHNPRGDEKWVGSHLELWSGIPGAFDLLPGHGWIFPMGDGIVNVGFGSVTSRAGTTNLLYREVFKTWTANLPKEWGFILENQIGQLRSAALPMSFNRKPHYAQGLVLVGDTGGMVSPYSGEGITPVMKAGRCVASCIAQALSRSHRVGIDRATNEYPHMLRDEYSGYYQLGRIFVALIENPTVIRTCTNVGLPILCLMTLVRKPLSDGYERTGGDFDGQLITMLTKAVHPA